ncbi:DUF2333 family protein [Kiritimatiellaeota bacterium B1221]|nr:DUF2333 family protein [Kiritimatiellaeota bacterium B1221]
MNNFADDEFKPIDETPKPEAKEKKAKIPADPEVNDASPDGRKSFRTPLRVLGGLFVVGTAVSLYWARIPQTFDVNETVREMGVAYGHRELDEPLPLGYRTVATTIHLAQQLLEKPGGYQSNDWSPMTRIPDNMRNWEKGAVVQLRVMVQGLRFELSRSGPNSGELPELNDADARFNYNPRRWILQSTESQFKQGVEFLEQYLERINTSTTQGKFFTIRQDQVINFLERQKMMLGTYATNLQKNIGTLTYDTGVLTENIPEGMEEIASDEAAEKTQEDQDEVTSIFERDDVFYQARGGLYVMYHTMLAMRKDCEKLLNDSQSMGIMNRIINELESACKPMESPIVLNGKEFGAVQNHSLVLAGHVAKAHLAVQELQKQIAGGGSQN